MRSTALFRLFLGLVFCTASIYAAEMKLEIIPLQYRNADEIIPIIQPLVHEGGTVTGMNNQLIVKTTATNLAEIKQILAGIDKAARRLLVTVKQNIDGAVNTQEAGVSGRYSRADVSISSKNSRRRDSGLVLSAKDDDGNHIHYRNLSTRTDIDDKNTFQVQTVDGKPAYIQTGQQVPVANQNAYVTNGAIVVQDTIEYHDVYSGFYVLPRVNGDLVTLFVSPQLSGIHPHQSAIFDIQNAETTITGHLGEWLEIGGTTQHVNTNDKHSLLSTRRRGQEQRAILIKVEEIQ